MFGAAHFLLLWEGDILFSYAVAALMLMVVLYVKPKPLIIAIVAVVGLGFIPGLSDIFAVAAGLAAAGLHRALSSQRDTGQHPRPRCAAVLVPAALDRRAPHRRGGGVLVVT